MGIIATRRIVTEASLAGSVGKPWMNGKVRSIPPTVAFYGCFSAHTDCTFSTFFFFLSRWPPPCLSIPRRTWTLIVPEHEASLYHRIPTTSSQYEHRVHRRFFMPKSAFAVLTPSPDTSFITEMDSSLYFDEPDLELVSPLSSDPSSSRPSSPSSSSLLSSVDSSHQQSSPRVRQVSSLPLLTPTEMPAVGGVFDPSSSMNVNVNVNANDNLLNVKSKSSLHSLSHVVDSDSPEQPESAMSSLTPDPHHVAISPSLTPQSSRRQLRARPRRLGASTVQIPANVEIHADSPLRAHLPTRTVSSPPSSTATPRPSGLSSNSGHEYLDEGHLDVDFSSEILGGRPSMSSLKSLRSIGPSNANANGVGSPSPMRGTVHSGMGTATGAYGGKHGGGAKGKHPIFPAGVHHDKEWEKEIHGREYEREVQREKEREMAIQRERDIVLSRQRAERRKVKDETIRGGHKSRSSTSPSVVVLGSSPGSLTRSVFLISS